MVQRLGHCDGMSKNDWKRLRYEYEMDGDCKMDRQNKNAVVLERAGERRIMLELIKRRRRNWLGHWIRRVSAEGCSRRNRKRKECSRQKKISDDNIMINGLYKDTKRKAEKRVDWRVVSLQ